MDERVCVVCGTPFHANAYNQLTCSYKCSKISNHNMEKERRKIAREEREKADKIKRNVCDEFCDGCVYKSTLMDFPRCCNYLLATGKVRPCPAGTGCTVKLHGKKRTRQRLDDEEWEKLKKERKKKYSKEYWEKKKSERMQTMTCPLCGEQFETSDTRRRYCSKECSEKAKEMQYAEYERIRKELRK